MAPQVWNDFVTLVCAHPVITGAILILFTPPFFPIVKFFSPLLISTALFMLALFTMGPKKNGASQDEDEDWTLRRDGDGEKVAKRMKPDGSWKDWVKSIEESSLSWMSSPRSSSKLHKNWKNDENVSILEEASWVKGAHYMQPQYGEDAGSGETSTPFMPNLMAPSELFKVDSGLQSAAHRSIYSGMELSEDAPELEDVMEPVTEPVGGPVAEPVGGSVAEPVAKPVAEPVGRPVAEPVAKPVGEPVRGQPVGGPVAEPESPARQLPGASVESSASVPSHGVQHQPMETLQIPTRATSDVTDSPSTDLDDESPATDNSKRVLVANLQKSALNAHSLPGADTPAAGNLSLSGKFKQMETLGQILDVADHAGKAGQTIPVVTFLKPTTAEQVEDVKDHLSSFLTKRDAASSQTEKNSVVAPSQAKPDNEVEKTGPVKNTTEKSKELSDSTSSSGNVVLSDSDSEMEIFPSADPTKMKLHPPRKLGTSQSLPQGEISGVTQ